MNHWLMTLLVAVFAALLASCSCGDDDDDSSGDDDQSDDDQADDDAINADYTTDDDTNDDDTTDDDADDDLIDDDTIDDDTADDDTADDDTVLTEIDFEDYALGALPEPPWVVNVEGNTTYAVANSPVKDLDGQVLVQNGGSAYGDSGMASHAMLGAVTGDVRLGFDVWTETGTYFMFFVWRSQTATYLMGNFSAGVLSAYDYSTAKADAVDCAVIAVETLLRIEVEVYDDSTYSVFLDGAPTDCTGLANQAEAGAALTSFAFGDGMYETNIGNVYFDNLLVGLIE